MLGRLFQSCLLHPEDIPASRDDLEVIGAFNPGAAALGNGSVLLVRVAERPRERRPDFTPLPRWCPRQGVTVDWIPDSELDLSDPRVVRRRSDGLVRLTFLSHLRVVHCGDGRSVTSIANVTFLPEAEWEEYGVEDPRITLVEGRFYVTYVAVSRHGVVTALASTTDFRSFERHGILFGPENKDVVLFPERINGNFVALHRPSGGANFARPEMWLAVSPDLVHWGQHAFVHAGIQAWESRRVGAGPPPIRVPEGWLMLYHGNEQPARPGEIGTYVAGALLLDRDDPARILRKTSLPIFSPEEPFEQQGFVPNVVFPTGVVERGRSLLVYYGAADTCTGVVEFSLAELLDSLG